MNKSKFLDLYMSEVKLKAVLSFQADKMMDMISFLKLSANSLLCLDIINSQYGLNLPKFWPFARIQLQCFMQLRYKILTSTLEA